MHTTVRIEGYNDRDERFTGTGFFFNFLRTSEKGVPCIVTNRHVVSGIKRGVIHVTLRNDSGDPIYGNHEEVIIDDFEDNCIKHPDSGVDLAILPCGAFLNKMRSIGKPVFFIAADFDITPNKEMLSELTAMEEIVMVGYPNGIWDSHNNLPIMRRGITATPFYLDYKGKKEFVIDAACFPGSSGSPVFLVNTSSYTTRSGGTYAGTGRVALLGILYAGPQHNAQGEIVIVDIPTAATPIPISRIPNNLGFCIKVEQLRAFEDVLIGMGAVPPEHLAALKPVGS